MHTAYVGFGAGDKLHRGIVSVREPILYMQLYMQRLMMSRRETGQVANHPAADPRFGRRSDSVY